MEEIWKDVVGYEGLYKVSNTGKVKSFHDVWKIRGVNEHIMTPAITKGYEYVCLRNRNGKSETCPVHRLVALAFIPNPNGFKCVNHKDENKQNNSADNLEWCTLSFNFNYGTSRIRQGLSCGKPVEQFTLEGFKIAEYCSAEVAGKLTGFDPSSIHKCCKNKRESASGYRWKYKD